MTAHSELFVDEGIRDAIKDKFELDVDVDIPDNWKGIWDDSQYPDSGEAVIRNQDEYIIGKVTWKTKFTMEDYGDGKFIQADVDMDSLEIKLDKVPIDDHIYVFREHDLEIKGGRDILTDLVNLLRDNPDLDLPTTIGDIIFQIECELRLNGMNPEGVDKGV